MPHMKNKASDVDLKPKSFQELLDLLKTTLGGKGLDELTKVQLEKVQKIVESYESKEEEWINFVSYDPCRYTRNLVDDGNGKYNLIIMAWNTDQKSPIHDHAGSHCIMKILKGELLETQYEFPTQEDIARGRKMRLKHETTYSINQTTYINDSIGLHRVSNPSKTVQAASLHIYTPPIEYCTTYCEEDSTVRASGKMIFHNTICASELDHSNKE